MPATVVDGLWGTPSSRHEAACASGSIAILAAIADLRSGAYETALVVGIELEKTVPGDTAAQHLGAAAWTGHEGEEPSSCGRLCSTGSPTSTTADTASTTLTCGPSRQLNFANARKNPNAQTRGWTVPSPGDPSRRRVQSGRRGPVRRFDCSQMTDGGAGVVLVTDDYLAITRPPHRPDRRLGPSHRRPRPAAEAGSFRRRPVRDAPRPRAVSTPSAARTSPSTTSTASRCTTASRPASTSRSTTSG